MKVSVSVFVSVSVLVLVVSVLLGTASGAGSNCTACHSGGTQCCSPYSQCCSSQCCLPSDHCCEGMCCSSIESCCPDKLHGSVCCIAETSYCCPGTPLRPSHCCPHWNVCCPGGRYGCCDPGNLRYMENNVAYALFTQVNLKAGEPLSVLKIDLSTGHKTEVVTAFNDYGETVRSFVWAHPFNSFVLPQTDYLSPGMHVNLNVIDAETGALAKLPLAGVTGDVTGFCWTNGTLILGTYTTARTGYNYYTVDVGRGVASLIVQRPFPNGVDDYSGWFKRCISPSQLVRMGFQDVVNEVNFGVAITKISAQATASTFYPILPPAGYADQFATVEIVPSSSANVTMLFLCPIGSTDGAYSLCKWSVGQRQASVVAKLGNSHETDYFGPVSTSVNDEGTQFGAITISRSLLGNKFDRWEASLVSLVTGSVTHHDLSPWMVGETDNVAGMGFIESSK